MSAKARKEVAARRRQKTIEQADRAITAANAPEPKPELTFLEKACTAPNGKRHEPAFKFLSDANRHRIALAGRQSGKTWAVFVAMIDVALKKPGAQGLYLTFSKAAMERTTWPTLKRVIRAYGIECDVVEGKGRVDFPNGSQLYFLGHANIEYLETFRGGTLDIAVVDEAGATSSSRLRPLVDGILVYCLRVSRGPLLVIGTPPRKKLGWFAEQWFGNNGWSKHSWTGADNPFVEGFEEFVADEAKRRGVGLDDPTIRRENFVEWVDDASLAVVPNFHVDLNTFAPDPESLHIFADGFAIRAVLRQPAGLPVGNWFYSMGVDPGSRDRLAVEVAGWTDASPNVYQVAEFVAKRDANHPLSVLVSHIRRFFELYGVMPVFVDTSGKDLINTLVKDHNIHSVQAARKVDREGQLVRVNDLAGQRRLQVVRGSALAEDCVRTEWSEKRSVDGPRKYSDAHHPDGLDAYRYGLAQYWNLAKPEDKRTDTERTRDQRQQQIQQLLEANRRQHDIASTVDLTADVTPW